MPITIAVAGETLAGERRVALVPETAKKFIGLGVNIRMEQGAGKHSQFKDNEYLDALTAASLAQTYEGAQLILRVTPPTVDEINAMPEGAVLIGLLKPYEIGRAHV